jgi:hypothetical protein
MRADTMKFYIADSVKNQTQYGEHMYKFSTTKRTKITKGEIIKASHIKERG